MATDIDFLGRGFGFPFTIDHTGGVALASGHESIEGSMTVVISTAPGERVMRPEFGCAVWQQLFDPINQNTLGLMSESVRQALSRWEPRVEIESVLARPAGDDQGRVDIEIDYRVRDTNERRNLVYPFYVIGQE